MVVQDSKLYWINVKIFNNKNVYQETDQKYINELRQILEELIHIQNDMLNMAEDFQSNVREVKKIIAKADLQDEKQQKMIVGHVEMLHTEINILQNLFDKSYQKQNLFEEELKRVELLLRKKYPNKITTLKEKIKMQIRKNR